MTSDMVVVRPNLESSGIRGLLSEIHERSASRAYAHIFAPPFPREESRARWLAYAGDVALAQVDGRTVGFVAWSGDELDALYVLPEAAGTGAGTALHDQAVGATRLWVLEDNAHARRFYEKKGWSPSGRTRSLYGDVRDLEYVRDPS